MGKHTTAGKQPSASRTRNHNQQDRNQKASKDGSNREPGTDYREIFDAVDDAILIHDIETGAVLDVNQKTCEMYGWLRAEAKGKNVRDLIYKESLSEYRAAKSALLENGQWFGEIRQQTKDGKEIIAEGHWTVVPEDTGKPKSMFAINTDVTERKQLEAQYLRAQRMESIGTLASGIAHNLGHGELILVVDDEKPILEIAKGTLEENGYRVLMASDGTEALAIYAEHKNKINAVLMDMMMPYLDGPATIRALQKLDPGVRVIASSALSSNDKMFEAIDGGVKTFLMKPYTTEKLLRALAEVLGTI